ncbi:MAG: response regulator [Alphaproteobacteria bacterium]|nr:response regulator [Alphaproteobacteria bacterium]
MKPTYTILIVDDNEADRELYKSLLEGRKSEGENEYLFYEAETATEAWALFSDIKPDCVLLDYKLPDFSGEHVVEGFSEQTSILPVIMLTGYGDEALAVNVIKKGVQDYIPKKLVTRESLRSKVVVTIERSIFLKRKASLNKYISNLQWNLDHKGSAMLELMASMNHEINASLMSIRNQVELLEKTLLTPRQREMIKDIHKANENLVSVMCEVLDTSRCTLA